jgi:hypothetical protein
MPSLRWKDGREGAATLCYFQPSEEMLIWIATNHFAVGIRATVITTQNTNLVSKIIQKNWDVCPSLQPEWETESLPSTCEAAQLAIESVVKAGGWSCWIMKAETWTAPTHRSLLSWLGDHHARIWCAPRRDIAAWIAAP